MGDLNCPGIDWASLHSNNPIELQFCNIMDNYNFVQLNDIPSRKGSPNVLDVILTNCPDYFSEIDSHVSLVKTDHFQLQFNITTVLKKLNNRSKPLSKNRKVYLFKSVNLNIKLF